MRSGALACVLCLAACYDDAPGARLVIRDPGFGAHKVELFVATRDAEMGGVAPDKARTDEIRGKLRGDAYFLDGPGDGTTPITELPVVGGQVVWNLQADPETPKAKIIVAVAYDQQGTAIAIAKMEHLEIPTNDTVGYVLHLEAATQIAPSDSVEPPGVRVWPWRKASAPTTAACLGLEYSNGTNDLRRLWLVPEDDPDCDEVEVECDDFFWFANDTSTSGGVEEANCFSNTPMPRPNDPTSQIRTQCFLGERACVDGMPPGTCSALTQPKYCVANAMCNPNECTMRPDQCTNAIDSSFTLCTQPVDDSGSECTTGVGAGPMMVDLFPLVPVCKEVKFVAWDVLAGGVNPVDAHVESGATFTFGPIESQKCRFEAFMDGSIAMIGQRTTLLLALDVTLPMDDHLLVPLVMNVISTCDEIAFCTTTMAAANESIASCH